MSVRAKPGRPRSRAGAASFERIRPGVAGERAAGQEARERLLAAWMRPSAPRGGRTEGPMLWCVCGLTYGGG